MDAVGRQALAVARLRRLHPSCEVVVMADRRPGGVIAVKVYGRHGAQEVLIDRDGRRLLGRWIQRPSRPRAAA